MTPSSHLYAQAERWWRRSLNPWFSRFFSENGFGGFKKPRKMICSGVIQWRVIIPLGSNEPKASELLTLFKMPDRCNACILHASDCCCSSVIFSTLWRLHQSDTGCRLWFSLRTTKNRVTTTTTATIARSQATYVFGNRVSYYDYRLGWYLFVEIPIFSEIRRIDVSVCKFKF